MKKIAIIGCGGINSWSTQFLNEILEIFDKRDVSFVKLFDEDIVEEKNLLRKNQNFQIKDLMENKADVLAKRYGFDSEPVFITEANIAQLSIFDYIIVGVDNHKTRKLLYQFALDNKKNLLDLRAQGTRVSYFVLDHKKGMDYYNKRFFSNPDVMERKGGCQLKADVVNDHIENGNKIIAMLGIYGVFLKMLREEELATKEYETVY